MKPLTAEQLAVVAKLLEDSGLDIHSLLRNLDKAYPGRKPQISESVAEWLRDECDYSFDR